MLNARIVDGLVVELIALEDGVELADAFHPDLVSQIFPCSDGVEVGWTYSGGAFSAPVVSLDDLRAAKKSAVDAKVTSILAAGAASGGLHIALDDSSRADMGSMATTALAAASSAVPWPDSYKEGWISMENTRIPLATPADGLALAAGVGDYYAKVRQTGRTLKDAIAAAATESDLTAIDINAGWPVLS